MKTMNSFFIPLPWWCYVIMFLYFVKSVKHHKSNGQGLIYPYTAKMNATLYLTIFLVTFAPLHTVIFVLISKFYPLNLPIMILNSIHTNIVLYLIGSSPVPVIGVHLETRINNNNFTDDIIYWLFIILNAVVHSFVQYLKFVRFNRIGFKISIKYTDTPCQNELWLTFNIFMWNVEVLNNWLICSFSPKDVIWQYLIIQYSMIGPVFLSKMFTIITGYSPPLNKWEDKELKLSMFSIYNPNLTVSSGDLNDTVNNDSSEKQTTDKNLGQSNSCDEGFVKYHDTKALKLCRENVLQKYLDALGPDDPLAKWLKNKASHLLVKNTGNTNIPLNKLTYESLSKGTILKTNFVPSTHSHNTGVYVVQNANKDIYVGSALDFKARWSSRYFNPKDKWYDKIPTIAYTEIGLTPNYTLLFFMENQVDTSTVSMLYKKTLHIFTVYEVRLLEQALITNLNPNLNSQITVTLTKHIDLEKEISINTNKSRKVTIKLQSGKVIELISMSEASRITGVRVTSIRKALKYENLGNNLKSPLFNEIVTFSNSEGLTPTQTYQKRDIELFYGITYDNIPGSQVWVYNFDIEHVNTFDSVIEAAKYYKVSRDSIYIYVNNDFFYVPSVKARLLFVRNPEHTPINTASAVIVLDNKTGQAYSYSSNRSACDALAFSIGNIKPYLNTNRVWKDQFIIYSTDNAPTTKVIEGPKTLVLKPVKSNLPVAYVVDTATIPATVHSFIMYNKAVAFIGGPKSIQNTPSYVFKPYADTHKLYKDRYFIYTTYNLPSQYTKDVMSN